MIDLCLIMYVLYSQFRYVSSVSIRTITINRDIIQLAMQAQVHGQARDPQQTCLIHSCASIIPSRV